MTIRIPLFQVFSGGKQTPTSHEPPVDHVRRASHRHHGPQLRRQLWEQEVWATPHNGWSNYPTWLVYYAIAGEDAIYRHWLREAARIREAQANPLQLCEHDTHGQFNLITRLSSTLCEAFYSTPLVSLFGGYSELLLLSLGRVDWQDLAIALHTESAADSRDGVRPLLPNSLTDGRIRFWAGGVTASPNVLKCLSRKALVDAMIRHQRGDWGIVDAEQRRANEAVVNDEGRLMSAYQTHEHVEFLVITDHDRAATSVFLSNEY